MTVPDRVVAGRYRLGALVGSGAMGMVYRAEDERLRRTVALKQVAISESASAEARDAAHRRVIREGRMIARLQHPNAIAVFDVVDHEDLPWLVMEYLPSRSLAEVLAEDGPLAPRQVADLGRQVAAALAAAHEAGIVHRDVKPGNVLLAQGGLAKVTDFGIARAVDDATLTSSGMVAGTPAYLTPEVARGASPDFRSDVGSLGSTLYAAVEGAPPYGSAENALAVLHRVASADVGPPRRAGGLTPLLLRLLDADPERRPVMPRVRDELARLAEAEADTGAGPITPMLPLPDLASPAPATPAAERAPVRTPEGTASPAPSGAAPSGAAPSGGAVSGGAVSGGAVSGGAVSGGAVSGGAVSGGAVSGGAPSGGAPPAPASAPSAASAPNAASAPSPGASRNPASARRSPSPSPPAQALPPPAQPGPTAARPGHSGAATPPAPPSTVPATTAPVVGTVRHPGRRRRLLLLAGAGAVLVAVAVAAAVLLGTGATPSGTSRVPDAPEAAAPGASSASGDGSGSAPSAGTPVQLAQQQAVVDYYGLLPDRLDEGWQRLTPRYQQTTADGFAGYRGFWTPMARVTVRGVSPSPGDGVDATVTYTYRDGRVVTERTVFAMAQADGIWKIDASTVVSSR